jgi:beta-lactamase regulating signal transducer with metallopeptidase domain
MNQLVMSLAWCWLQVMVVAFLAIVFSALAMRRSPASGATIAAVGIVAALVLTLLAPVPVPRWGSPEGRSPRSSIAPAVRSFRVADRAAAHAEESVRDADISPLGIVVHFPLFDRIIMSVQRSQAVVDNHTGAGHIALGILTFATMISLARVVWGMWGVAHLHRASRMIADDRLAAEVQDLANRLGMCRRPVVRESNLLMCAAVIGMWRPAVLLPGAWRRWPTAELRAVIAHELAHIRRRDLLVRSVAALTVAVQCVHPLVYWLRRRLVLAQEMAADELAASALGSRAEYLHSLTSLALRHDSRPIDGSVGTVVPVFSGFLVRRIEMLRAMDGSTRRPATRPLLQWTAIALVVAAAAVTMAIRGLAQPPDGQADKSIRVGRNVNSIPKPVAISTDAHSSAAQLFHRSSLDPAVISGENGGFLVRLGELSRRHGFAELALSLYEPFATHWKSLFPTAEPPDWSINEIEYVAGDLFFGVKPLKTPTKEGSNQVMFGAPYFVVRWEKPLDG